MNTPITFVTRYKAVWLWLARVAVITSLTTPLVVLSGSAIFPFVTGKAWFFQITMTVAAMAWGLLILADPAYRPRKHPLHFVVLAFLLAALISTITGVDAHRSFWANHERMIGSFFVLHLGVLYFVATSVFATKEAWRRVWKYFLAAGALIIVSALIQHWRPDFLYGGTRAASTLGNPIYMGLHAVYVAAVAALLWLELRTTAIEWKRWIAIGAAILIALSFVAFVFAETRGVAVGLGAAFVWMLAWIAVVGSKRAYRWSAIGILIVMTLGIAAVVLFNNNPALYTVPIVRRFSGFSLTGTNANRLFAWQVAVDAWKERPLLGWGPFNYAYAFNQKYQGTQLVHNQFGETWFDNAHNFFLDTLATQGIVGFIAYLLLFLVPILLLMRAWRRGMLALPNMVLMTGLLIAHAVQNIFAFEQISSYLSLFAVLGYVHTLTATSADAPQGRMFSPRFQNIVAAVIVIGGVFVIYRGNIIPFRANLLMFDGLESLEYKKDASAWFLTERKAIDLGGPFSDNITEELARSLLQIRVPDDQYNKEVGEIFKYTIARLEDATRRHPRDPVYHMLLGEVWYGAYFFLKDMFPHGPELGDKAFEEAVRQSPERQQLYFLWAQHAARGGDVAKGIQIILKARSFAPHSAFVLQMYSDYLYERNVNQRDGAWARLIAVQLSPESFGPFQDEEISLNAIRWASAQRGIERLRGLLTCAGSVTEVTCPHYAVDSYVPSDKVFQVLIGYSKAKKDDALVAEYSEIAKRYFPDKTF